MLPRVWSKLQGKPSWINFYDVKHRSGALFVWFEICREFARVAKERGKRPLIMVIPTSQDVWYARDTGLNPSASLLKALREQGTEHLDVLPRILQHLGDRDVCEIFSERTWLGYCWGHYNPEGDRVIAAFVQEHLSLTSAHTRTRAEGEHQ